MNIELKKLDDGGFGLDLRTDAANDWSASCTVPQNALFTYLTSDELKTLYDKLSEHFPQQDVAGMQERISKLEEENCCLNESLYKAEAVVEDLRKQPKPAAAREPVPTSDLTLQYIQDLRTIARLA